MAENTEEFEVFDEVCKQKLGEVIEKAWGILKKECGREVAGKCRHAASDSVSLGGYRIFPPCEASRCPYIILDKL